VIRGTVKAQDSELVVPGARVTVTDTADAVLGEVTTAGDGKFFLRFAAPGRFIVTVRKVGWKPSFTDPISAAPTDTMLVDFLVPAEPTTLDAAEIRANAVSTFNSRALSDAERKGWKVISPATVDTYRDIAGNFIDLLRESGTTGLNLSTRDCIRSIRYNRCMTYVLDGVPAGTSLFVHPRDIYFIAVLSATQSASQWGDKAPWGAIAIYTRMHGDRRRP